MATKGSNSRYFFVSHASADNARLLPIVRVLLKAGIPLWFDKPDQLGLRERDFHGCIDTGDYWDDAYLTALKDAAGIIAFPSERYKASADCIKEINVADFLSRFSDREYAMYMVSMSKADMAHIPGASARFQAKPVHVDGAPDTGFALSKTIPGQELGGEAAIEDLVERLKAHLANATAAPGRALSVNALRAKSNAGDESDPQTSDVRRENSLPYLIDRVDQGDIVRSAFSRDEGRRPIFIAHGPGEQEPHRFVSATLPLRVLCTLDRFSSGENQWPKHFYVALPSIGQGLEEFIGIYRGNLKAAFQGVSLAKTGARRGVSSGPDGALSDAILQNGVTFVVASILQRTGNLKEFRATLGAWTAYWDAFPFPRLDDRELIAPILVVEHPPLAAGRKAGLFGGKADEERIVETLRARTLERDLSAGLKNVAPRVLPEFPSLEPADMTTWVRTDQHFSALGDDGKDALRDDLAPLFSPAARVSMKHWADGAKPILARHDFTRHRGS